MFVTRLWLVHFLLEERILLLFRSTFISDLFHAIEKHDIHQFSVSLRWEKGLSNRLIIFAVSFLCYTQFLFHRSISLLYTDGDFCEATGKKRIVEVKLKYVIFQNILIIQICKTFFLFFINHCYSFEIGIRKDISSIEVNPRIKRSYSSISAASLRGKKFMDTSSSD